MASYNLTLSRKFEKSRVMTSTSYEGHCCISVWGNIHVYVIIGNDTCDAWSSSKWFPHKTFLNLGKLILHLTVSENFHSLDEQTVEYEIHIVISCGK